MLVTLNRLAAVVPDTRLSTGNASVTATTVLFLKEETFFLILPTFLLPLLLLQVLKKRPDFKEKPWPHISASAKDFVKKLLKKDPRARPTAAQALCECCFHDEPEALLILNAEATGSQQT